MSLRSATAGESMGLASCAACVLVLSICPMLVGSAVPGGAGAAGVRHWPATMLERILRDGACLPVLDRNSDGACAPGLRRTSTGTFEEPLLLRGGRDGAGMPEKDCFSPSRVPRPGPDLMWKQDVGERYRQLVPPRRPSRLGRAGSTSAGTTSAGSSRPGEVAVAKITEKQMQDAVAKASLCASAKLGGTCVDQVVMFVDIDKAAIFGNDGNDFGIALQWMERPHADVVALYKLLLNPNVKETYKALSARAKKVEVVLYTMRASFLVYNSMFRGGEVVPLLWNQDWHVDGQLFLPTSLADSEQVMAATQWPHDLLDEECVDVKKSLERLLAVREVIQAELKLQEPPRCVVTAQRKNVASTATELGFAPDSCYLWDDNTRLASDQHVVRVAPYVAVSASRREALLRFLYRKLPPQELDGELVDFLLSAPPSESALLCTPEGNLEYHVPCASVLEPWALPETGVWARVAAADAAADAAARAAAWDKGLAHDAGKRGCGVAHEGGSLSPVTPPDAQVELQARDGGAHLERGLSRRLTASLSAPNLHVAARRVPGCPAAVERSGQR